MKSFSLHGFGRMQGFTLIELMIVIVIVGILASIAYPAYQNQVERTRRTDGKVALMETAQRLERCYTRFGRYNHANCDVTLPLDSAEEFYEISAAALTPASFTLAATPQGVQAGDTRCGVLQLTSANVQGSLGALTDANDCW